MKSKRVVGKETTPFLLKDIAKETKNKSLDTNISLALNNVRLGAKIARCF
jgi:pseudouridine-5'-phosphate glycosidase